MSSRACYFGKKLVVCLLISMTNNKQKIDYFPKKPSSRRLEGFCWLFSKQSMKSSIAWSSLFCMFYKKSEKFQAAAESLKNNLCYSWNLRLNMRPSFSYDATTTTQTSKLKVDCNYEVVSHFITLCKLKWKVVDGF